MLLETDTMVYPGSGIGKWRSEIGDYRRLGGLDLDTVPLQLDTLRQFCYSLAELHG